MIHSSFLNFVENQNNANYSTNKELIVRDINMTFES